MTLRSLAPVALGIALATAACSSTADSANSDSAVTVAKDPALSYVGQSVVDALGKQRALTALKGKTWEVTTGNVLSDGWLLPTIGSEWWGDNLATLPTDTDCKAGDDGCDPDFLMRTCDGEGATCSSGTCTAFAPTVAADGQEPKKLCVGYADWFEEAFYQALVNAESFVDITSLWLPADRFLPAIKNGIARLAARNAPVTVRILSGNVSDFGPRAMLHTSDLVKKLSEGLPKDSPVKLYVAEHSASLQSWNHSKMIVSDGKSALVGGHNMHTADYQLKDPVSDLSMRLTGPAAAAAHRYANEVWDVACSRQYKTGIGLETFPASLGCPKHVEPTGGTHGTGDTAIIAAGRTGAVKDNASDAALLAMVDAATTRIVMSQEDILGGRIPKTNLSVAPPPNALLDRLAVAIGRGVDVYLVISNVDGGLFTTSYSHGWSAEETAAQMAERMKAKTDAFPAGADIVGILCDKLHVAPLRLANTERWADGKVFSNHAKFLMIDDQALYVGSQNLYTSDLAEFGYIVDSKDAAKVANDTFWSPLWNFSKAAAASGSDAPSCTFRK
jgi:phosphatidylserine/phosphatidylglycerophosphate/cardiolipin synthase-like enzyme